MDIKRDGAVRLMPIKYRSEYLTATTYWYWSNMQDLQCSYCGFDSIFRISSGVSGLAVFEVVALASSKTFRIGIGLALLMISLPNQPCLE